MAETSLVWTLSIRGQRGFFLAGPPHNPPCEHVGGTTTIWKFYGTAEEAQQAATLIRRLGASVNLFVEEPVSKDGQTDESYPEEIVVIDGNSYAAT